MVKLQVNGQTQSFDGDASMPLLWYLRDELGLTGTKFGCGVALCGACTVHIDGEASRSCAIAMSDVTGRSVTTIEGLDRDGNHPVQRAWRLPMLPSVILTTSASGNIKLSRLDGWPMRSPVNASPAFSRIPTHDSGPVWFARPSL
jgi:hypothetical protein